MKKILSLVLGIILILSVVSFADDSSSGKSGDDRTLDDRERLDKRNNEFSEFREELNARKEAKRDVKEAKNELERVKVAYKNVKENYQSKKMELLQSRNKYRDCLNSEEEQCRLMVKKTNMITKEHLINSLDLIIKNLEQMKSNMQLSADLTHEEISEITNVIDEQIKKMQDARLKLETIDENTSRDEIREAASNIRQLWQEVKVHHNKIKLRHLGARLRTLIVKAEIVGERAREKASAMNLEKLNSLIENYEDELEKAKSRSKPDICISGEKKAGIKELKELIYKKLRIISIYLKEFSKKADMSEPLIMWEGSTLRDLCSKLHKDFVEKFKFAKIWGKNVSYPGQQIVKLDFKLSDGDIVELRMK